jgi:thymidylate synthase
MRQYLQLCEHILQNGNDRKDRTGTGTRGVFGYQMRFDLNEGFPLLTTKDMVTPWKEGGNSNLDNIIYELLFFLSGSTDLRDLLAKGCNIWNGDGYRYALEKGFVGTQKEFIEFIQNPMATRSTAFLADLGRIYPAQWRSWRAAGFEITEDYPVPKTIDQISNVIEGIKEDPFGRRHLVSAWNPGELDQMSLPPCHVLFQFYVAGGKLSCQLYQRSGDVFLGVGYNIASYALLTMMIADQCGLGYGEFIHTLGDAHIYNNHIPQVMEQIKREPKPLPKMTILRIPKSIFDYKREDFFLSGYDSHPAISGKVSVGL